jgi:CRP-like cAMP-binding protein
MRFYGDFLSKFEPMSIKSGSIFCKEGTSSQEVFFLLRGHVEIVGQNKTYVKGTIFGETDIILKNRPRTYSYKARGNCYILKLDKLVFMQILDEFEDIRESI